MKHALLVIDVQNDFCPEGLKDCKENSLATIIANLRNAVATFRQKAWEVIFIQYFGDEKYQKESLKYRNTIQKRKTKCLEDTWGSDFFEIVPLEGEKVFPKHACFDAFLNPEFQDYLQKKEIQHLIFSGFYLDVCVDSTMRTAFQKGYYVSALEDCTKTLFYPMQDCLQFMKRFYGASIVISSNLEEQIRQNFPNE